MELYLIRHADARPLGEGGSEDDARMAAVKFRAFLRRYHKPAGLTIRLADEQQRDERT